MADFETPGRSIRAALRPFSPYVNPCAISGPIDKKRCKYPGMDVELLTYMFNFLGINYTFDPISKAEFDRLGGWGKTNANDTGLDGLLGKVISGTYDTVCIWYGMNRARMSYADFSYPILYTRPLGFILKKPSDQMGMDASALLYKVFSPMIWIAVGALSVGLITLLFLAPNIRQWMHGRHFKSVRDYDYEGFWGTICIALHQYHGNVSTGTKFGNIAMISAGFLFLFTSTLYEGVLVGALMTRSSNVPFSSLSELADLAMEGKYRLASDKGIGNAFFWDIVAKPESIGYIKLNRTIEAKGTFVESDLDKLLNEIERDPKLVWPGQDRLSGTHWVKKRCGLIFLEDTEASFEIPSGFPFRKGSEWPDVFTPLLANTASYVKHLEDKYIKQDMGTDRADWPVDAQSEGDPLTPRNVFGIIVIKQELETDRAECPVDAQSEGDPLTLRNMFGIIVVSCLMFGSSILALFGEILMKRFQNRMLERVHKRMPAIRAKVRTIATVSAASRAQRTPSYRQKEDPMYIKAVRNHVIQDQPISNS